MSAFEIALEEEQFLKASDLLEKIRMLAPEAEENSKLEVDFKRKLNGIESDFDKLKNWCQKYIKSGDFEGVITSNILNELPIQRRCNVMKIVSNFDELSNHLTSGRLTKWVSYDK